MDAHRANDRWLRPDCERLGLRSKAGEKPVKTHEMRRGFSSILRSQLREHEGLKAEDMWGFLRGDHVKKLVGAYTDIAELEQVRDYYMRFAPRMLEPDAKELARIAGLPMPEP